MSTKTPENWASDPQARALRVDVSSERALPLPFDHFTHSELTSEGKDQRLRLVFTSHEVVIRGHALRRLETVMQRMELAFVTTIPGDRQSLTTEGQPVIVEIVVAEVGPPNQSSQASKE